LPAVNFNKNLGPRGSLDWKALEKKRFLKMTFWKAIFTEAAEGTEEDLGKQATTNGTNDTNQRPLTFSSFVQLVLFVVNAFEPLANVGGLAKSG